MAKLLKDLYNKEYIELLSKTIKRHISPFNETQFIGSVFDTKWSQKTLKERREHIASTLSKSLTKEYKQNIAVLIATFKEINYDFYLENMIFQEYVALYGLDDFQTSMQALREFTINSSSEFAIRQFLLRYKNQTLKELHKWCLSKNEHIRRLASEGCRPRLPWGIALYEFIKDPTPIIEILRLLKDDKSAYVRKSVANNLNDISKEHPSLVISLAKEWLKEDKKHEKLLRHACRSLLKKGDKEALALFGYYERKEIKIENFYYDRTVFKGEEFSFSFELIDKVELGLLRIEYALYFLRKNGTYHKKVFQIAQKNYKSKKAVFTKRYSFKNITTRTYYIGTHEIALIVNGVELKRAAFDLTEAPIRWS